MLIQTLVQQSTAVAGDHPCNCGLQFQNYKVKLGFLKIHIFINHARMATKFFASGALRSPAICCINNINKTIDGGVSKVTSDNKNNIIKKFTPSQVVGDKLVLPETGPSRL